MQAFWVEARHSRLNKWGQININLVNRSGVKAKGGNKC